jgi:hypothetical protein
MVETPFVCETTVFYTVLCQYSVLGGVRAARRMVPLAGIEPAACCLRGSCSDQHELKRHEKTTMEPFQGSTVVKMGYFRE